MIDRFKIEDVHDADGSGRKIAVSTTADKEKGSQELAADNHPLFKCPIRTLAGLYY